MSSTTRNKPEPSIDRGPLKFNRASQRWEIRPWQDNGIVQPLHEINS